VKIVHAFDKYIVKTNISDMKVKVWTRIIRRYHNKVYYSGFCVDVEEDLPNWQLYQIGNYTEDKESKDSEF
jgi:hypothetical protein